MTDVSEFTGDEGIIPDQIVYHVDMDCFYAACERLRRPELENEPVVIGMNYEKGEDRGIVATASYEARDYGVESTQTIGEARKNLPPDKGHYFPVDAEYYDEISDRIMRILREMGTTIQKVSEDEAYLDATAETSWEDAKGYGQLIKNRIQDEVGVIASIGAAPTMSAAKIASDYDKPNGLHIVPPNKLVSFLSPLDVEEIHEVGPKTASKLRSMGIRTAGDLANADPQKLKTEFGQDGIKIYNYARGADDRTVKTKKGQDSFLRDETFENPTVSVEKKREKARNLAQQVAKRAQSDGAMYKTVGIKVVSDDIIKRSKSFGGPIDDPDLVEEAALDLLEEFRETTIVKLGVALKNLNYADQQQSGLGSWSSGEEPDRTETQDTDENEVQDKDRQTSLNEFK